jgi:hypothetical protein
VIRDVGAGARIHNRAGFRPQAGHIGVGHLAVGILAFEDLTFCRRGQERQAQRQTKLESATTSHDVLPAAGKTSKDPALVPYGCLLSIVKVKTGYQGLDR